MASPNVTNGSAAAPAASAPKPQLKAAGAKPADASRKQTGSPIDGAQRKPPAQKAWTSGTNPITQRPSNPSIPNGAAGATKAPAGAKNMAKDAASTDNNRHAHDRMLFLLGSFTGLVANITLKNGEQFSGIFHGASLEQQEHRYTIKMAKRVQSAHANGANDNLDEYCGVGEDHVLTFDVKDVVDLNVDNVVTDKAQAKPRNGASSAFRTDTDISGNLAVRERELQPWLPSGDTDVDLSLEGSGSSAGWDQFATNERLYGAQSTYNEEIYTTKIDRSNPLYKQRAMEAERIAREIESGSTTNSHVAEERGQNSVEDSGLDEEERYSGVRRAGDKYTPPARRAPTSQPTVSGAPVDPAIISSQIARPGSTAAKPLQSPTHEQQSSSDASQKTEETRKSGPQLSTDSANAGGAKQATVPAVNVAPDASQKSTTVDSSAAQKPARAKNTVETELLDRFKEFSASEKMKVQERARFVARHDKSVKLNDLKKFAKNFSYSAPIPDDLIPILAKDPSKQQEIKQKSMQSTVERKPGSATGTSTPATTASGESKAQPRTAGVPQAPATTNQPRRTGPPSFPHAPRNGQNIQQIPPRNAPGGLGQRLAMTQQQHKAGMPHMPQPLPLQNIPVAPMGHSANSSGQHTPTSSASTRFNPKVTEFRPNPSASTFTPGGEPSNSSSPRTDAAPRPESRRVPTTSFWGSSKPNLTAERPALNDMFNPIKRMKKSAEAENKTKEYATNGGIPQAYRTPPTWESLVPQSNREKSYVDMFDRSTIAVQPIPAPQTTLNNNQMAHQHQLPPHLQQGAQGMPPVHTPQHTPRHPPVQPHHGPGGPHHFDGGHHMQFSASQSSVHPSPRAGMPQFLYGTQGPQGMPQFPQNMPFHMSPNVQNAAMRVQPGFVPQGPGMGAPIMMHPVNGPMGQMGQMVQIPGNPQMQGAVQMYSPVPHHVYPHAGPMPMHPAGSGFPSPRPPVAQMMSHQGSQQGHPQPQFMHPMPNGGGYPQVFMQPGNMTPMRGPVFPQQPQPHFNSSPHQNHHYPNQQPHRGTPAGAYAQPMMPSQSMGGPPMAGPPPAAVPGPHAGGPDGAEKTD